MRKLKTMRLYIKLLVGLFLLQLISYGIAGGASADYPIVDYFITPASFVGMVISRSHSLWPLWSVVGITITALLYALVVWIGYSLLFMALR